MLIFTSCRRNRLNTCSQVKLHAVKFSQQQRPDPHFRRPQTFNLCKCKLGTKDGKLSLIRFKDRVNVVRPAAACYTGCIIGARTAWRFCYRIPRMQSEIAISSVIQKKSAWNIRHRAKQEERGHYSFTAILWPGGLSFFQLLQLSELCMSEL